jgi:hypothetical protein
MLLPLPVLLPFPGGGHGEPLPYLQGAPCDSVASATLREALEALWHAHPGLRARVLTEQGANREHISVFVGNEHCRHIVATPDMQGVEIPI